MDTGLNSYHFRILLQVFPCRLITFLTLFVSFCLNTSSIQHRRGWRRAALSTCGSTQDQSHQLCWLGSESRASCHSSVMESENSHRKTSAERTPPSRSSSSEYAAPSIQLAWEEETHFVTVPLLLSQRSRCPAQEMIHWRWAECQAELAEDHRDRLGLGAGGWVVKTRGVTLTCSRLRVSCQSCMLDDSPSHRYTHLKSTFHKAAVSAGQTHAPPLGGVAIII